ncbi:putative reverse transcriptase domain-containing protein [Tanacetum coccineum]
MSSALSAVTYTSVYTDSKPGRVFWGADEEVSDGGSPRVIVLGYDGLPIQPVAPPSPDYIPGPEDPQTPPVPQDEDERGPMFIQAHDPDYVPEPIYPEYIPLEDEHLDPEEDPKEYEDDETEDGPVDYPINGGDDDDGDSSRDDADEDEDGEEDEHLALADSAVVVPTVKLVSPLEGTKPIIPQPFIDISTTGARITVLLQASISLLLERLARCTAPLLLSSPPPVLSPLLPSSGCPTQIQTLRIASTQTLVDAVTVALPSCLLPPLPPSLYLPAPIDRRDDIPESEQPPRKRSCLFALGSRYKIGESSTAIPTGGRGVDYRFVSIVDVKARRQGISEVGYGIRDTWATHQELQTHRDHVYAHETHIQAHQAQLQLQSTLIQTHHQVYETRFQMQQAEMAALRETDRRRQEQTQRSRQPAPDARIPDHQDASGDADSHSTRPKTLDETIELANDWMDQKLCTYAERQTDNKRKAKDSSRNNYGHQQQPFKRQNVAKVYNMGIGERKPYGGNLPKCTKCYFHDNGPCTQKCHKCNKVGHFARDCRSSGNTNVANTQKGNGANPKGNGCFECGAPGHFKKDCPKLKNKDEGNRSAQGWVYAVGNASRDPDSNVVTGTFLLNNHYASILFDTGADRSFISTAFSSLINIAPTPLENSYDVELADGKIVRVDTIMRGCTLNFLNHPFNIDLMPVELGSFDVIIGMDWLRRCHAVIVCDEKLVQIPYGNETLIFHGNESNNGRESRLTIISCSKAQEYMAKGCQIFLAQISAKKEEDKSEGKRLKDSKDKKEHEEYLKAILESLKKEKLSLVGTIDGSSMVFRKIAKPMTMLYSESAPNLALPEGSEDFMVYCDASHKGLGVVLMQREKGRQTLVAGNISSSTSFALFIFDFDETLRVRNEPLLVRALVHDHWLGSSQMNIRAQNLKALKTKESENEDVGGRSWLLDYGDFKISIMPRISQVQIPLYIPPKLGKLPTCWNFLMRFEQKSHILHVSNLKKCYADEPLVMPLEGIHVDDKLQFMEEPIEIMEWEIKRLKRSRIPLVKVRWNSRRGPEFTWEREDSFKQKYP